MFRKLTRFYHRCAGKNFTRAKRGDTEDTKDTEKSFEKRVDNASFPLEFPSWFFSIFLFFFFLIGENVREIDRAAEITPRAFDSTRGTTRTSNVMSREYVSK